jgi:heptosyltransferase-1
MEEKRSAEFIAKNNTRVSVLDKQSLTGLARHILSSAGVIAVDTGLGHLAAALATPTLSLYGPTDPGLSGTFGRQQLQLNSNLNCAPCVKKVCGYAGPGVTDKFGEESFAVEPPCFSSHPPEHVWQQFEKLINE